MLEMVGKAQRFSDQTFEPVSDWCTSNPFGDRYHNPCITVCLQKITKPKESTGLIPTLLKQKIDGFSTLQPVFSGKAMSLPFLLMHSVLFVLFFFCF
jgi:hypothetical protein